MQEQYGKTFTKLAQYTLFFLFFPFFVVNIGCSGTLKIIQNEIVGEGKTLFTNHRHPCDEGSLVDTGLLRIYRFMLQCENFPRLRGLNPQNHFEKKPTW